MNPRKLSSDQREQKILGIIEFFCEENNFDDPVPLGNFAAKLSNDNENASVFEPQLQLTVLKIKKITEFWPNVIKFVSLDCKF